MAAKRKTAEASPPRNLTDWFSMVFIINCQHRPDRLAQVTKNLTDTGMADMRKVIVHRAVVGDYTGHPAGWGSGRGAWGCMRSHQRILEDAMHKRDERENLDVDSILILEDDVVFFDDSLERLNAFMPHVPPDWGQIYLGGQNRKTPQATAHAEVRRGLSVHRTHAHAISRQYLQKVYAHICYMPDYHSKKHIDHQLELAHQRGDWPVYCPTKWLCGQEAGTSNVSGKLNDRKVWS